jgi:hypothetical protein
LDEPAQHEPGGVIAAVTSGALAKRSSAPVSVDLLQPSTFFASSRVRLSRSVSAWLLLTLPRERQEAMTHEPSPDLHLFG